VLAAGAVAVVHAGIRHAGADEAPWKRSLAREVGASGLVLAAAVLAGLATTQSGFGMMNALAHAVFIGVPLALLLGAALDHHARLVRLRTAKAVLALLITAVGVDAFFIEPTALEVNRHEVAIDGLERPLTVVVLADFQAERIGEHERRALLAVREAAPDLVLIPGDLLQVGYGPSLDELRRDFAALVAEVWGTADAPRLKAPILVVGGDVDFRGWRHALKGLPLRVLAEPFHQDVAPLDALGVDVTGLNLQASRNTEVIVPRPGARPHIVFGHAPDFALGSVAADLLVAGHTHGGQVQLPLIGPLLTLSHVPRDWAAGVSEIDDGRTLVVSRGVGMERYVAPRLRFLCRPEVVVLELVPPSTAP
jgi:predicted MPP superfamily phosphohydrolase